MYESVLDNEQHLALVMGDVAGTENVLVREDGREGDVFSLIGPKRYDAPWKDIEAQGYIAPADCIEVRVTLPERDRMAYATAEPDVFPLGSVGGSFQRSVNAVGDEMKGSAAVHGD